MQREWDEEALGGELWDALQLQKHDPDGGLAKLAELAAQGSALAMMYLGHAYVSGDPDRFKLGEQWLIKSAEGGSVEGRLQLALHYQRRGAWDKALAELQTLVERGYSPAMFLLGKFLYHGELGDRRVSAAVEYLTMANDAGHLPSMALLSRIYRREKYGIAGRIASHWLCLTKIPAILRCMWTYPNSDRLRPYGSFSESDHDCPQ